MHLSISSGPACVNATLMYPSDSMSVSSVSFRVTECIREEKELSRNVPMHTRGVECTCVCCASDPGKEGKKEKKNSHPGQMVRPH